MTHLDTVANHYAGDDFKTLRRYSRQEAAAMLRARDSWLKRWVTDDVVPHQRSGKPGPHQRGVWFTYDDILAIGRLMPSLMSGRQANCRAEGSTDEAPAEPTRVEQSVLAGTVDVVRTAETLSPERLAAYASLVSLRA